MTAKKEEEMIDDDSSLQSRCEGQRQGHCKGKDSGKKSCLGLYMK